MMGSSTLRAVARNKGAVLLAISSVAQSSQQVQINCFGGKTGAISKAITLAANATVLVHACERDSSTVASVSDQLLHDEPDEKTAQEQNELEAIGIQLDSNAGPGQFAAFGISRRRVSGDVDLGAVPFEDPKLVVSSSNVFAGMPVGPTDLLAGGPYQPYAAVANFSIRPAHVNIRFSATFGVGDSAYASQSAASEITLPPQRTTILPLADLQGDPGLRNSFITSSDAKPGDLSVSMASLSRDGESEVELLGKDGEQSENMGVHPWSVANGNQSTLLLFNHTDQTQSTAVEVISGSSTWQKRMTLKPFETFALSINDLIQNKFPDERGNTLASGLVVGEVQWTMSQDRTMTGRLLLSNKTVGMARNFSCNTWSVLCGALISPGSASITAGSQALFSLNYSSCLAYNIGDCSGSPGGGAISPFYDWNWSGGLTASCGGSYSCSVTGNSVGSQSVTGTVSTSYCRIPRTASVTVKACPSSVAVDQIVTKALPDYDHPSYLTGVGILARMKVTPPSGTDSNGAVLVETVTPTSNSCPSSIRSYTDFPTITQANNSKFTVGSSASWEGNNYASITNDFYDSHKLLVNIDVLGGTGVNQCSAHATQTYLCNGSTIGTFTLTNKYSHGTLNGKSVTNVSTTKQ